MKFAVLLCPLVLITAAGMCLRSARAVEPVVVRGADAWRYLDLPLEHPDKWQPQQWQTPSFDDSTWPQGQAMLGYGDQDVVTELSFGNETQQKQSAAFFRRRFRLADRGRFRLFRGRVCCDDGAVVYINGREVYRHNLPSGEVSHLTQAIRAIGPESAAERAMHDFEVVPDAVHDGDNVVAVSVHQANGTSSDLAFDFELLGLTTEAEVTEFRQQLRMRQPAVETTTDASLQFGPVVGVAD